MSLTGFGELPEEQLGRVCGRLAETCSAVEQTDEWPADHFQILADAGVLGWVIPAIHGGSEISAEALTAGYERLAAACLTTTFILTQRNGACQRIAGSENEELKSDLLPRLCTGELFATVGISHLTTSRQHLKQPVVEVTAADSGYVLNGTVPWVTGADHADYIVTGGTLGDGRQMLVAVPTVAKGVICQEPARLLALNASRTGGVSLENVHVTERLVIAGPVEQVMKHGSGGGAGSLTTSALAVGTAAAAIQHLQSEAERRPELVEICRPLALERETLSEDLRAGSSGDEPRAGVSAESIRQRANSLVLRATQAYLAASKGAGFVAGHPAERLVREAMFFLVWSCPQPVLHAALREFACVLED